MWNKISKALPAIIWLLAIIIRIYLIFLPAQPYDIGTYSAWGRLMLEHGPRDFFTSTWSDYLPFPIYLFSFISWLSTVLNLSFTILFKSFFSIIELGLIAMIYSITRRSDPKGLEASSPKSSPKGSDLLGSLLLLSPVLILNTSWWGQTDSLPALLGVISLLSLINSRIYVSAITLALAVAFKPIILLILPIFAILFIKSPKTDPPWADPQLIKASLLSFSLFLLPALLINHNPLLAFQFLLNKALEQASTYPYTTINAFNIWNIRSSLTTWPPDNQLILGLSLHSWGTLIFSLLSLNILRLWRKANWSKTYAPRVIATIFAIFFTFTTRMHERHLLFAIPFLALAVTKQFWLLIPLTIYSILYSFNLWAAYSWVIHNQTWPIQAIWGNLTSIITTLTTLTLATIWSLPKTFKKVITWLQSHKMLFIILTFSTFLRFTSLNYPSTHIFDEVYHAFTAQELVAGNLNAWIWWATPPEGFAYEWTHPPVAKYGMVAGLTIFGDSAFAWRFFSAVMGVISIYGIYRLTRTLFNSRTTANLAAFLVSIEGLHLVQSRIGMNDIYMLTFFIWSLNYALRGRWKYSAILFGLSLASKWSALYGLLPLSFIFLHEISLTIRRILYAARLIIISIITYLLSYTPFLLSGYTWTQLGELHRQMWYYHTHLVATHAYQSTPLQWIFSLRPVWYWV
ncbi:MAG: hypothetical protein DRJ64_06615, partial [Thermoprotei archaeon]